jgi:hypothetical protein
MSTGRETVQICAKRRMPICVARNRRDQEAASSWHSQWHPGRARRHGHRGGRCEAVEAAPSHVQLGPATRLLDPGGACDRQLVSFRLPLTAEAPQARACQCLRSEWHRTT